MSLHWLLRCRLSGSYINCFLKQQSRFTSPNSGQRLAPLAQYPSKLSAQNYSSTTKKATEDNTTWTPIYHLPMIRGAAGLNRLKIYQAVLTALALPVTFGMTQFGQLPTDVFLIVGVIGTSGLMTLTLASLVVRNVIGYVYLNDEGDQVKLAFVDFWGNRREKVAAVNDLEVRSGRTGFYQTIRIHNDNQQAYKLLHNYGVIKEPAAFVTIFGE